MHDKFVEVSGVRGAVTFEQFIRFMVDVTEDQNTAEQVFESFREVADGKVSTTQPRALWVLSQPLSATRCQCNPRLKLTSLQPYVTELDLRHSLIPDELIDHLVQSMPEHRGPDLQEDRDMPKFDYVTFMEKFVNSQQQGANGLN